MKTLFKSFALLLLCMHISCATQQREGATSALPALQYLDTKIASWVDSGYYNGASVRIMKGDDVFFQANYGGYSDTTALHVASAGKWVASAVIASIVDEGKLSWDDKVSRFIPEIEDTKRDATLRQLFSHTSGYPDYQPEGARRDDYQTLEEAVSHIIFLPAMYEPGTHFHYGGLAMQVAGRMAEIATGKDWETLFQEKIAQPLGMQHSLFAPVSEEPGFNPMLGGGFKTCVSDYMNFLKMFANNGVFDGKQVLSEEAVSMMQADQVRDLPISSEQYVQQARQNTHNGIYGLGLWREELDAQGNPTLISSPGWAGAYPWIDKKNKVYGFIIAKVNGKAFSEGFSSFYAGAVLPLIVRDALKQMNYPAELKKGKIDVGDAQLYYEEMGEGTPVVLLHGHSLSHAMWDEQFYELAKNHRVVRFDFRGYGYSSPQTETEQFTHVEDLIKVMDSLKIDKAHIVGLSMGGYVGADMLGWFPDRILSMVLASGNVRLTPKPSVPMDSAEIARRDFEIAELKKIKIDVMKREWFGGLMRSGGTQKERMQLPLWSMIYQWDAWQPLHKEVRLIAGGDAYDKLKVNRPKVPVIILEGETGNNPARRNQDILNYLPNGRLEILLDAGHMMNMERPEEFNKIVMEFIHTVDN